MQTPDDLVFQEALELGLATPAIWIPDMNQQEWDYQVDCMIERSLAARALIDGQITPDEFEQAIDQYGVDVIQMRKDWDRGVHYFRDPTGI